MTISVVCGLIFAGTTVIPPLLIRRLRARFELSPDRLVCVGTSATLGGDDSVSGLLDYASSIFSSPFRSDAVITEQRVDEADFLDNIAYLMPGLFSFLYRWRAFVLLQARAAMSVLYLLL